MFPALLQETGPTIFKFMNAFRYSSVYGTRICGFVAKLYSTDSLDRKSIVRLLDNREDPEADAAVKQFLRSLYNGTVFKSSSGTDTLTLTSKVERKYAAAQVVENGIQNISLPLTADKSTEKAPLKRYVAELLSVSAKAGFEDPIKEVEQKIAERAAIADTVKELLVQVKPYVSSDFHSALLEALQSIENAAGTAVTLDPASDGYKKFAARVKEISASHNVPVSLLSELRTASKKGEELDKIGYEYLAWLQSSRVDDAAAEIETVKSHAVAALDSHLSKTSEQIKKESELAMQQLHKKIESAKGAKWAQQVKADLSFVNWFDQAVAKNPAKGLDAGL